MDDGLCVSQEHERVDSSDSDSSVHEIKIVEFNKLDREHVKVFCGMLWEFYWTAYGRDESEWVEVDVWGHKVPVQQVEASMYMFIQDNCDIKLAMEEDECVGFLIYNLAYNCVLIVRALYTIPEREARGVGKSLVDSIDAPVKKLIFQTYKPAPPQRLLDFTKSRRKEIHTAGNMITWEMDWES